jgi:ABC-type branched-subunit amino acid transport system ATPase component
MDQPGGKFRGNLHECGEVLRVEGLTVQYGALVALRDVSWSVHANEILIMAQRRCKSTCFAAVANAVTRKHPQCRKIRRSRG